MPFKSLKKRKQYRKQWRDENPKKAAEYFKKNHKAIIRQQREAYKRNIRQIIFRSARNRALKKGILFKLKSENDLPITPKKCPILGIRIYASVGGRGRTGHTPSLDRINPMRGYVKGNLQIISDRANVLKNSSSLKELILLGKWATKKLKEE